MVSTIVNPQQMNKKTNTSSNNANIKTLSNSNKANVNKANVNKANVNKANVNTAIPFKNLKGSPRILKKQPHNVNVNRKSRSKSISGGFNLSPIISAILLAGIKLSLNQNKKRIIEKSKSTSKSSKSSKSTSKSK
jgi:hypothetical protein